MRRILNREAAEKKLNELNAILKRGSLSCGEELEIKAEKARVAEVAVDGDRNKAMRLWIKGEID